MKINMHFQFQLLLGSFLWLSSHLLHCFQQSMTTTPQCCSTPCSNLPPHGTQSSLCISVLKVCRQFVPGEPQPAQACPLTDLCFSLFYPQLPREVVETSLLETLKKCGKVAFWGPGLVVLGEQLDLTTLGVFSNLNNTVNKLHSLVLLFQPWHSLWCSTWIKAHYFMYIFVSLATTVSEQKQENWDKL